MRPEVCLFAATLQPGVAVSVCPYSRQRPVGLPSEFSPELQSETLSPKSPNTHTDQFASSRPDLAGLKTVFLGFIFVNAVLQIIVALLK